MVDKTQLSASQEKVLGILREHGGWMTASEIQSKGGSCASLPKLKELQLIHEGSQAAWNVPFFRYWKAKENAKWPAN